MYYLMKKVENILWKSDFEKLIVIMLIFFCEECGKKRGVR